MGWELIGLKFSAFYGEQTPPPTLHFLIAIKLGPANGK